MQESREPAPQNRPLPVVASMTTKAMRTEVMIGTAKKIGIVQAIKCRPVSTRLLNAIQRAEANGELPYWTLGEVIADAAREHPRMLRVMQLGRKSFGELVELADAWLTAGAASESIGEFAARLDLTGAQVASLQVANPMSVDEANEEEPFEDKGTSLIKELAEFFRSADVEGLAHRFQLSHRLRQRLSEFSDRPELTSVGAFLSDPVAAYKAALEIPNLGRKSIQEWEERLWDFVRSSLLERGLEKSDLDLIRRVVWGRRGVSEEEKRRTLAKVRNFSTKDHHAGLLGAEVNPVGLDADPAFVEEFLEEAIRKSLDSNDERSFHVLVGRNGLFGRPSETLEAIGVDLGVTRERIRQIEKGGMRRCCFPFNRSNFRALLVEHQDELRGRALGEIGFLNADDLKRFGKNLRPEFLFALRVVGDLSIEGGLGQLLKPVISGGKCLGWVSPDGEDDSLENSLVELRDWGPDLPRKLREAVLRVSWPPSMSALAEELGGLSTKSIEACLLNECGGKVLQGHLIDLPGLRKSNRIEIVLKTFTGPMTPVEICSGYRKLFNLGISVRDAQAHVGRLASALIVERGKYAHYDALGLSSEELATLSDSIHSVVSESGSFLSAKVVHHHLSDRGLASAPRIWNDYVVLGIAQDDPRMVTKPGLMIGLLAVGQTWQSLTSEVGKLIARYGPQSVPQLIQRLSRTRDLLEVSLLTMLSADPNFVMIEGKRFDLSSKIFGDPDAVLRIKKNIRALFGEGALTPYSLVQAMSKRGFKISEAALESLVRSDDTLKHHLITSRDSARVVTVGSGGSSAKLATRSDSMPANSLALPPLSRVERVAIADLDDFISTRDAEGVAAGGSTPYEVSEIFPRGDGIERLRKAIEYQFHTRDAWRKGTIRELENAAWVVPGQLWHKTYEVDMQTLLNQISDDNLRSWVRSWKDGEIWLPHLSLGLATRFKPSLSASVRQLLGLATARTLGFAVAGPWDSQFPQDWLSLDTFWLARFRRDQSTWRLIETLSLLGYRCIGQLTAFHPSGAAQMGAGNKKKWNLLFAHLRSDF
jgi:hypothetical protein